MAATTSMARGSSSPRLEASRRPWETKGQFPTLVVLSPRECVSLRAGVVKVGSGTTFREETETLGGVVLKTMGA